MSLLFWLMFVPVVAGLFLEAFVIIKLCDRIAVVEGRQDAIDLVDEEEFFAQFAEYTGVPDRRRQQLAGLATMSRWRH